MKNWEDLEPPTKAKAITKAFLEREKGQDPQNAMSRYANLDSEQLGVLLDQLGRGVGYLHAALDSGNGEYESLLSDRFGVLAFSVGQAAALVRMGNGTFKNRWDRINKGRSQGAWRSIPILLTDEKVPELSNTDGRLQERLRDRLLLASTRSSLRALGRSEPRLPLELTKAVSRDDGDDILNVMATLSSEESTPTEVESAKKRFPTLYLNSYVETESALFALKWLNDDTMAQFLDVLKPSELAVYDAGCAAGEFREVLAIVRGGDSFAYYGQDYNPEWEKMFSGRKFYKRRLPDIERSMIVDIVCCLSTLHLLAAKPSNIVATVLQFNAILQQGGHCIISVPEKEGQPGMLDVLLLSLRLGKFTPLCSGRYRLSHSLTEIPARNVTTYVAILAKKIESVDDVTLDSVLRASSVDRVTDLSPDLKSALELATRLMREERSHVREFNRALEAHSSRATPSGDLGVEVRRLNRELSELLLHLPSKDVARVAMDYLDALLAYVVGLKSGSSKNDLLYQADVELRNALDEAKPNNRIELDPLTLQNVAKLVRNLFEVCNFHQIDLFERSNATSRDPRHGA